MPTPPDQAEFLRRLAAAVAPGAVKTGADIPSAALHDWSGEPGGTPLAHVTPRCTAQVSAVLALCHASGRPVVPQGGLTGLAGGAVPSTGAVLISLAAMAAVEEVDPASGLMLVQAGATLHKVQEAAAAAGMMFALDLGARGSCQIGGMIATNAGGNRVIRYGMARDLVLGLEVVLADGTVLPMLNRMPKNNAGLDLKPLFIGSEGTLGVITRAVLRLHPGVAGANAALVALPGFDAAVTLLRHAQRALSGRVSAFELMWADYYAAALTHGGARAPLPEGAPLYALIEMQGADPDADRPAFEAMLEAAFEQGWLADAVLAHSQREVADFWALRDAVAGLLAHYTPSVNFDVSVPLAQIGDCVAALRTALAAQFPGLPMVVFGHAGDSNIHLITGPITDHDPAGQAIEATVYGIIRDFGGSVSAEHGIGLHKKPWLGHSRSPAELALLAHLKASLDPRGILNPGKVL